MCSAFTSPFPTKSCVSGAVRFIQTRYGLYKPDCDFWIWPECQSQRLGFFDGSSNWGFTYTSYDLFRYIFNVNQLHTFYHVFVNPSPLKGSDLQRHEKTRVVLLPFPTKSCVSGDVRFIQTRYGLYKPDCVFWIWPECRSQRLDSFDGSSNWDFTTPVTTHLVLFSM